VLGHVQQRAAANVRWIGVCEKGDMTGDGRELTGEIGGLVQDVASAIDAVEVFGDIVTRTTTVRYGLAVGCQQVDRTADRQRCVSHAACRRAGDVAARRTQARQKDCCLARGSQLFAQHRNRVLPCWFWVTNRQARASRHCG
jgi:hypothetical protein